MKERQPLGEAVDLGRGEPDALALAADGDELEPAFLGRSNHRVAMLVIDIDHRAATVDDERLEQPELGGKISLDTGVIVEMVAAQIGEARGGHTHAVEP